MTGSKFLVRNKFSKVSLRLAPLFFAVVSFIQFSPNSEIFAREAEPGAWEVSGFSMDILSWGVQIAKIKIVNNSDEYKFVAAVSTVTSQDRPHSPPRTYQSNSFFLPRETRIFDLKIEVPGNLTPAEVKLNIYDVIDTLDDVALGKRFYSLLDTFRVDPPEPMKEFVAKPPRASGYMVYNKDFNTDLAIIVAILIARGKSSQEISEICGYDLPKTKKLISKMGRRGFIGYVRGETKPLLSLIENYPEDKLAPLISSSAQDMTEALSGAVTIYRRRLAELVDSKVVIGDTAQTAEGTALLHRLYLVVGGIVLWEKLGMKFLDSTGEKIYLLDNETPCYSSMGKWGSILNNPAAPLGDHYYYMDYSARRRLFGVNTSVLECRRRTTSQPSTFRFKFESGNIPKIFRYDTTRTSELIDILVQPGLEILSRFEEKVTVFFNENGIELTLGHRYWLWNRLATETLQNLVDGEVIENREGKYQIWKS
ncbi:MAG: hypothetical protein IIB00_11330 [candidate division Zixibacteria bacterium]|nr:hypothetical protein [candidate division Zixibacteria bacterium]